MNHFGTETQPDKSNPNYWIHERLKKLESNIDSTYQMIDCLIRMTFLLANAQMELVKTEDVKKNLGSIHNEVISIRAEYNKS